MLRTFSLGGLQLLLSLLTICLTLSVPAQANEPSASKIRSNKILVGFAQDTLANDWRKAQVQALKSAFSHYPNIRFIYTDGKGSTAKQILDIENLIARGVDILITSPRDSRAMAPVITKVYRQGIPVILLTRTIEGDAYTTFIAPDDAAIARGAAKYIAKELHGRGNIMVLQGVPSASTTIIRTRAFLSALVQYPGLNIVAMKTANYLRSDAITAVEEVLHQGVTFDAIYAQSDSMASGARIALRKAGVDVKQILIVGIDYIREAREAIRSGQQSASYTYPTCAKEAVSAVVDIVAKRKVPKIISVPSKRVTRDNVDSISPIF